MADAVEHYLSGKNAWRTGFVGILSRRRTFWATVVLTVATCGTPWWMPHSIPRTLNTKVVVPMAALLIGSALGIALLLYRRYSMRFIRVGLSLHRLAHHFRDTETRIFTLRAASGTNPVGPGFDGLTSFTERSCERIRSLFTELTGDPTVECAVRLVVPLDSEDEGSVVYRTIGRTAGLNSNRGDTTEDLPANVGVARFFLDSPGHRGVLLYRDIDAAARQGAYRVTENDRLYPEEIVTMMVAPLNAWNGHDQRMIGILYVTSCRKHTFVDDHVDYVRFAADTLALATASIVELLAPVKAPATGEEEA